MITLLNLLIPMKYGSCIYTLNQHNVLVHINIFCTDPDCHIVHLNFKTNVKVSEPFNIELSGPDELLSNSNLPHYVPKN